ncbi:hypothetical protein HID58_084712 [Brassica napus]|uniref:RNase H type-1 domain-containing protein n=1 Tax=Brassica napus TaxID=3708 RepID=A0ABQ7XMZ5_BRANA|nr:hypothetical protein HID58_084712 [Brassica napus]
MKLKSSAKTGVYPIKFGHPYTYLATYRDNSVWKRAGLAWTSAGSSPPINENGTLVQDFVSSPLMAEPLVVRSALSRAVELEIPDLRVFTNCTTLLGEITCKSQRKEILGVLTDIRSIFTSFASIFFFHVSRSENKGVSSPVCIELGLRHVSFWAS